MTPPPSSLESDPSPHHHASRATRVYVGMSDEGPVLTRPQTCCLVLGPPRAGKTTSLIVPNVVLSNGPVVSVSTKADVLEATIGLRQKMGSCLVFDPTEVLRGRADCLRVGWSPLRYANSFEHAVLCAEAMVGATGAHSERGESHWLERASALLATLFHAGAIDGSDMTRVTEQVNRRDGESALEVLARANASLAADLLMGILATDAREQSGIWSTASRVLAAYRTESAQRSAQAPPVEWSEFTSRGSTLYIASPAEHQAHIAPLIAGLLRELRSHCYALANTPGAPNNEVLLVLDELANIAPLHDLPALVSEGASQGIVTVASLQDLSQAKQRWGVAGEGFLSLFGAKVVLGGIGDHSTLRALSALAGDHYLRSITTSHRRVFGRRTSSGSQVQLVRAPRLSLHELANPAQGTATVVLGATPMRCRLVPYDRERERSFS